MQDTDITKSFLHHVAEDILRKHGCDLSHTTVVFPNKRASLFLNERLLSLAGHPVWSPRYCTISDLFRRQSTRQVADDIKLVCDLFRSFVNRTGSTESLDRFYGWGVVLLSDFDDIDKSLANAHGIFSNLGDLHSFDTTDYLTKRQKEVLTHFFKDFSEEQNSLLRDKFLKFWSRFGDIYDDFNRTLLEEGLAYEGALYREVIKKERLSLESDKYIFIGFNALQKVEVELFKKIRQEAEAYFYWDFDFYYQDPQSAKTNEAGSFINEMLIRFPNELDSKSAEIYDHYQDEKSITFVGSPTNNMQARFAHTWLQQEDRVKAGNKTAIVMCDECVLPTLLHSIPSQIGQLNITTGFPLAQATITTLVRRLLELTQYGMAGHDKYRLKFVAALLHHPYAHLISESASTLLSTLEKNHRHFPARDELTKDEGLALLFRDLSDLTPTEGTTPLDPNQVVSRWLLALLKRVAVNARNQGDENSNGTNAPTPFDPLFEESVFRMYTLVNRLNGLIESGDLRVDFITFQRLMLQLIDNTKVPFHGEPARGLQIMGVLETRNLDFDHLLLLSCNDGNMPRGADDPSFIPYSLREAFGLPTSDRKVAIYAYYFNRLLQRANDITIMYRNTADDKQTGEMSRFMLQMMVESGHNIARKNLIAGQSPSIHQHVAIDKTAAVMQSLHGFDSLSPTAINRYIRCPILFFYNNVAKIKEPDPEGDEIDNRIFGNIFHDACQLVYDNMTGTCRDINYKEDFRHAGFRVERRHLEQVLQSPDFLERIVDQAFARQFFKTDRPQGHPEYNGLQLINREVIVHYLRQLLEVDKALTPFIIRGHEGDVYTTLTIDTSQGSQEVKIGGRIDRLDEVEIDSVTRRIRVVDYKTGSKKAGSMASVENVFSPDKISDHSDYFLQAMLYSMIVRKSDEVNPSHLPVSPALLFIHHAGGKDYTPVLKINKKEMTDIQEWAEEYEQHLRRVVTEIYEPTKPFEPTQDKSICKRCPYLQLCGKETTNDT